MESDSGVGRSKCMQFCTWPGWPSTSRNVVAGAAIFPNSRLAMFGRLCLVQCDIDISALLVAVYSDWFLLMNFLLFLPTDPHKPLKILSFKLIHAFLSGRAVWICLTIFMLECNICWGISFISLFPACYSVKRIFRFLKGQSIQLFAVQNRLNSSQTGVVCLIKIYTLGTIFHIL